MAIKINFDSSGNPEAPTFILMSMSGKKFGELDKKNIIIKDCLNDVEEISFDVYKYLDNKKWHLWDDIRDLRLIWCKEWNNCFKIKIDVDESTETKKHIYAVKLSAAELSQIMLYDIEINTETDIEREEYKIPTIFYNFEHPEASLLNRITEKVGNYTIEHVDATIARIQRTFTFNDISVYDAFQEIAKEIGCIFVLSCALDENGKIKRTISVYDLQSNCHDCGYRGEFTNTCPKCGSKNLNEGYGDDTTIFITSDELADDIQLTTNTDAVKNCFKLEAGDDLMTATIRNCNPNGSGYIWRIPDYMKEDMSQELVDKINTYDNRYAYYQKDYVADINSGLLNKYNALVTKYRGFDSSLTEIPIPVKGYPALMTAFYNTIDMVLFLQSGLMPNVDIGLDTSAEEQAKLLTSQNLSPVAVADSSYISSASVDNAVLAMAKVIVDSKYRVKINTSALSGSTWSGNFVVTNYSDENDTATSANISISISKDYKAFVEQKIQKTLNKREVDDLSINALFKKNQAAFSDEIKKYGLNSLIRFHDAAQGCIDILIEQGIADGKTWSGANPNLYDDLYVPYYNKLKALEAEMKVREDEINSITGTFDSDGNILSDGAQSRIIDIKEKIQEELDFEKYLGTELWNEFCIYRREDKYPNSNYISDGLNNAEIFEKALEFLDVANNELYKASEFQHSISTTLKNLLVIKKFKNLVKYFEVGNWLRIMIDEKVYKLRLLEYEIDFENIEMISVEFSDVTKVKNGITDTKSILEQAKSMATSYDSVKKQASQGAKGNDFLNNWVQKGLDVTNTKIISGANNQVQTWDEHGMLFQQYDAITDSYSKIKMKVINSTLVITDDDFKTVKTAVGLYYYFDPVTGELKTAYGVNAETLIGKLILGESLGIYSGNGNLTFDKDGLVISNKYNKFVVNPNSENLLTLSHNDESILWVDEKGMLHISGDGSGLDIRANGSVTGLNSKIEQTAKEINLEVSKKVGDNEIISKINQSAEKITIKAEKISLEGTVTANRNFLIYPDGSISAKNATFSGDISGSSISGGNISATNITGGNISGTNISGVNITGSSGYFTKEFGVRVPISSSSYWVMEANSYGVSMGLGTQSNVGSYLSPYIDIMDDIIEMHADYKLLLRTANEIELDTQGGTISMNGDVYIEGKFYVDSPSGIDLFTDSNASVHAEAFTIWANTGVHGSFDVTGTKSRIVDTQNYNTKKLYCYEMASPIFGDIGHGVIGNDGLCYIDIDIVFAETIDTLQNYSVFLQSYSDEHVYVYQKECDFFIVKGTPGIEFDFEIKAKQIDYSLERLEDWTEPEDTEPEIDYEEQAITYLEAYEKELIDNEQY